LKIIPQCTFEPSEPEKSVIVIKIEEKIGKKNLAIIQEEETFRIFGKMSKMYQQKMTYIKIHAVLLIVFIILYFRKS
jgi:hypothetical protein